MAENAATRFRRRASECRALANQSKNPEWREWLLVLARDLDSEVAKLEAEVEG